MLNLLTTCHQSSLLLIILSLKDIHQYLPNSTIRSVEKGNFLIRLMYDKTYSCFKIRHIQITCKEVSYCSGVKIHHFMILIFPSYFHNFCECSCNILCFTPEKDQGNSSDKTSGVYCMAKTRHTSTPRTPRVFSLYFEVDGRISRN